MPEIEKNYRICRRVYQSLFIEIASTFIQYINTLSPDEIDQLDDDIRPNGWGAQFIVEIENSVKLLHIFQMLYYFNGKLPLTNELLPVSDGETREGSEKISVKTLYEFFKDTKFHWLFSLQFLLALNLSFGGETGTSKDAITELYKNLSFKTLSGEQQIEFEKISDLSAHINFKMKHSILLNLENQDKDTRKNNENVKNTYEFYKKSSDEDALEKQIIEDIIKNEPYEHKKIEMPYVPPTVQDAQTIEDKIKDEIDDFLQTASEFNKIDAAATRQKK